MGNHGGFSDNIFLSQCEIVEAGESTVALTLSPPDDDSYEGPQQGIVNLNLYETRNNCRSSRYNVLSTITSDDYVTIVDNDPPR